MDIFGRSFPVINPYRLYESMPRPDGWHFSKTCPVTSQKVQKLIWDATKLAKGLKVLRHAVNQAFKPLSDESISEESPTHGERKRWRASSKMPVTPEGFSMKVQATSETAGEKAQATPPAMSMSTPLTPPADLASDRDVTSAKAQATPAPDDIPAKVQATLELGVEVAKIEPTPTPEADQGAITVETRPPPPSGTSCRRGNTATSPPQYQHRRTQ